jgi:hypothetical protein
MANASTTLPLTDLATTTCTSREANPPTCGTDPPPSANRHGLEVSAPAFLVDYLRRRDEQIRSEGRLCEQVMKIPVTAEELAEIEAHLRDVFSEAFGRRDA